MILWQQRFGDSCINKLVDGAGDRDRTGTDLLGPRDFKSLASAYSATPAENNAGADSSIGVERIQGSGRPTKRNGVVWKVRRNQRRRYADSLCQAATGFVCSTVNSDEKISLAPLQVPASLRLSSRRCVRDPRLPSHSTAWRDSIARPAPELCARSG